MAGKIGDAYYELTLRDQGFLGQIAADGRQIQSTGQTAARGFDAIAGAAQESLGRGVQSSAQATARSVAEIGTAAQRGAQGVQTAARTEETALKGAASAAGGFFSTIRDKAAGISDGLATAGDKATGFFQKIQMKGGEAFDRLKGSASGADQELLVVDSHLNVIGRTAASGLGRGVVGASAEARGALEGVGQAASASASRVQGAALRETEALGRVGEVGASALGVQIPVAAHRAEQALDQASVHASGLLGRLKGFGSIFGAGVGLAGGMLGFQLLSSGIGAVTNGMIGGAAEFERYETQLGVLLGSADKAKARLADLAEFGKTTPFELPDVVQADKTLTAFGIESQKQLRLVGDAAAGTGQNLNDMAFVFGRVASGGFGEAFQRLAELGIATRRDLEAKGLKFDAGGSFQGSARQAMDAVNEIVSSRFGGMMDKQSKTLEGTLSNLQDAWGSLLRDAGVMLLPFVKGAVEGLLGLIEGFRAAVGGVVDTVKGLVSGISGAFGAGGGGEIGKFVGFVSDSFAKLKAAVAPLVAAILPRLQAIGVQIGNVWGSLAPKIAPIADALMKIGGVIVDNLVRGFSMLEPLIGPFFDMVSGIVDWLGKWYGVIMDLAGPALSFLADGLKFVGDAIATGVKPMIDALALGMSLLGQAFRLAGDAITAVAGFLRGAFMSVLNMIGNGLSALLEPIRAFIDLASKIPGPWQEGLGAIRTALDQTQDKLAAWGTESATVAATAGTQAGQGFAAAVVGSEPWISFRAGEREAASAATDAGAAVGQGAVDGLTGLDVPATFAGVFDKATQAVTDKSKALSEYVGAGLPADIAARWSRSAPSLKDAAAFMASTAAAGVQPEVRKAIIVAGGFPGDLADKWIADSPKVAKAADAMSRKLPQSLRNANKQSTAIASTTWADIASAWRDGRSEWQGALSQFQDDVKNKMTKAKEIAKIQALLSGQGAGAGLAAGLKSKDPVVRAQANATIEILQKRLNDLQGKANTAGANTFRAFGDGIASAAPYAEKRLGGALGRLAGILQAQSPPRHPMNPLRVIQTMGRKTFEAYGDGAEEALSRLPARVSRRLGAVRGSIAVGNLHANRTVRYIYSGRVTIDVRDRDGGIARAGMRIADLSAALEKSMRMGSVEYARGTDYP